MASNAKMLPDQQDFACLHHAYSLQRPPYLNLLEDLGSTDCFLIDGVSLLLDHLSGFQQPQDWQHSCQTLPGIFQLERFVEALSACLNAKISSVLFKEYEACGMHLRRGRGSFCMARFTPPPPPDTSTCEIDAVGLAVY